MSLKAPFRSYKSTDDRDWPICCSLLDAESTGFGPKRLRCSVPPLFPIEHGGTSGHVLLGAQITWSPRQQATTFTPRFNSSSTRVTGLHPKKVKQASKLYPAGTVTSRPSPNLPAMLPAKYRNFPRKEIAGKFRANYRIYRGSWCVLAILFKFLWFHGPMSC